MERKTALLGGMFLLWRVPLERKTVGWTGVIPLKPMPPSVQHRCHPRLLTNSLKTGASGPQMTDSVEQCRWSDALRKALEEAQLDLGDIIIDQIVPGCPDDRVRSALDKPYGAWL